MNTKFESSIYTNEPRTQVEIISLSTISTEMEEQHKRMQKKLVADFTLPLIKKFFPYEPLLDYAFYHFDKKHSANPSLIKELVDEVIKEQVNELILSDDVEWKKRFEIIFKKQYPQKNREVWCNNRLSQEPYKQRKNSSISKSTYHCKSFEPIECRSHAIRHHLAPTLYSIREIQNEFKVIPTTESDRFINGEKDAVPKSSLFEIRLLNRPTYRDDSRWLPPQENKLPQKVIGPEFVEMIGNKEILFEFVQDLNNALGWESSNNLACYLGYLIQPMICHIYQGQMPGYSFQGPTKSGKGYASSELPSLIVNPSRLPP